MRVAEGALRGILWSNRSIEGVPPMTEAQEGSYMELTKGQRVWWNDPDDNLGSGPGTIVNLPGPDEMNDEAVIALKMDDGGEAEVLPGELEPLKKWQVAATRTTFYTVEATDEDHAIDRMTDGEGTEDDCVTDRIRAEEKEGS